MTAVETFDQRWPALRPFWERTNQRLKEVMARQERLSQKVRSTPATLAQFGAIHKGWLLCTKLEAD